MAKYNYKPMSRQEFARNLDDLNITLGQFCRLIGVSYDTVKDEWLADNEATPIPHWVRHVFVLTALPGGLQLMRQMTDAVIERAESYVPEKAAYGHGKEARERMSAQAEVLPKAAVGRR